MKCLGGGGAAERVGRKGCGTRGQIGFEADRSPSTGSSPPLCSETTWVCITDREGRNGVGERKRREGTQELKQKGQTEIWLPPIEIDTDK